MLLLIAVLALFVGTGVPHASMATIGAPLSAGSAAILAGVPLMISLFLGIESAVEIGEERSEEHTSELQSLMRISYAVFCLKKKTTHISHHQSQMTNTKQ